METEITTPYTRKELMQQYEKVAGRKGDRQAALELFLNKRFPPEHFHFWCGFIDGLTQVQLNQ